MKCIPSTLSGRFVAAPRSVIEIDDVFEARMTSGRASCVEPREQRSLGVDVLDDRFDDVVGVGEVVERRRDGKPAERGVAIGGGQLALLDELREALLDAGRCARSSAGCATSCRTTEKPDCANTWAMPLPIVPAPMTPIV